MQVANAFNQLGLPVTASAPDVRARYLELAKIHHPDHGGQVAAFDGIRLAYTQALEFASRPKCCERCQGIKVVLVKNGFSSLKMMCPECRGSGLKPMNTEAETT